MQALPPPAIAQPASPQTDVIEIVGARTGEALKIDRRTYQVQQTPHSAQKDTYQLLRGLPAITITADDQINLLGAPDVTVLIDGHATRTNLRTLHGSDIDRIEVLTNPSAQYSAEGTGGIINLVLRKKRTDGVSGNESLELSTQGRAQPNGTLKLKRKRWTYEVSGGGGVGAWSHSTYYKLRETRQSPSGPVTINTEDGGGPGLDNGGYAQLKATYEINPKTSVSAEFTGGAASYRSLNRARFVGLTPDFISFGQRQRDSGSATFFTSQFTFDQKGKRDGETLKASIDIFGNPTNRRTNSVKRDDGGSLLSNRRSTTFYMQDKLDWTRPLGKNRILSLGAAWDREQIHQRYSFVGTTPNVPATGFSDSFRAGQDTFAGYATYQQPIGKTWTVMPGLRVERNERRIETPGFSTLRLGQTDWVPSIHADHPIGKTLVLTLSYSRRLNRPGADQLRPYAVQPNTLSIEQGNPRLRTQTTDAYEINLHYHRNKLDAGLIVYDRETRRLISTSYSIDAQGRTVSMPVNAGHKRDRGAELDVNTPVLPRVKVSASVNLFSSRVPIDAVIGDASEERFRFTSNTTLEWNGPDRRGKPGDVAQLSWHYESPATEFQFRNFSWNQLTLSYTHNLDRKWSVTASADTRQLNFGHRLVAPLVDEYYRERQRADLKVKLMKTFGKN